MIEFLNYISANGVLTFCIGFVMFFIAFKEAVEMWQWWKGGFYSYHNDLNKKEQLLNTTESLVSRVEAIEKRIIADNLKERIVKLEERTNEQDTQFKVINDYLTQIVNELSTIKQDNDKVAVAEIRSILNTLYNDAMAKGYTTQSALEAFEELSEIYLNKNGNSIFKHHIIPEYKKLKVIDMGSTINMEDVENILEKQKDNN